MPARRSIRLPLLVCTGLALATSAGHAADSSSMGGVPRIGDPAPAFALRALDGSAVTRERLVGGVTVVEFFATWCGPCREGLADLQVLRAELGPGFVLLIVGDDDVDVLRAFFSRAPAPTGAVVAADPGRLAARAFGRDRLPTTFFLDPAGVVRHINRGHGAGFRARAGRWLRAMLTRSAADRPQPRP